MNKQKVKKNKRLRRKQRVRAKVFGTAKRPRLSVFRSLKHIRVQLIDDVGEQTLVSVGSNDKEIKGMNDANGGKVAVAMAVGKLIAKKALEKGIKQVVFDRGGYRYHGRVKVVAEGARRGGLKF